MAQNKTLIMACLSIIFPVLSAPAEELRLCENSGTVVEQVVVIRVGRVGRVRSVTLRCGTLRCETATEVACGILFGTVERETSN